MQVIIEITEVADMLKISAVQKNGAPFERYEYGQYVYHPQQVARAVKWVRDDIARNEVEVLDVTVNNMTSVDL